MNVRSLAFVVVAVVATACSSDQPPAPSGGAQLQLQSITGSTVKCVDPGELFTIADRTPEGELKLIVDGAGDANVGCKVDGGRFDVKVSNPKGTFGASGTYSGTTSTDAYVTIITPAGNAYFTKSKKCGVEITENGDGKFGGTLTCEELQNTQGNSLCAIGATTKSYFRFANCTGF